MTTGPSQTTGSSSTSSPWAPTQGALTGVLGQLQGMPTAPSSAQTNADQNLVNSAGSIPNFSPAATSSVNNLLTGGGANNFAPLFQSAYNQYSGQLAGTANPANNNPMTNPAIQSLINTTNNDTTNSIDSQFAAAGMTGSPGNAQALARGISQGESGILTNQYNTNVQNQMGAASDLFGAGNTTGAALSGLNQTSLGNQQAGITAAGAIPGLATAPATAQVGAANNQAQQPFSNMSWLTQLLYPMAALGGQSTGNSTTTGSTSPLSTILGGLMGGAGALGSLGGSGGLPALMALSDERAKEDIKPIGMLYDGTNVFSFRYKGDIDPTGRTHVGVMAQEVEKTNPAAVHKIGGVRFVDYAKVADKAAA